MDPIIKEFAKLSKSSGFDRCLTHVDKFIQVLESTKASILADPVNTNGYIQHLKLQLDSLSSKIKDAEKDIHSSISKYSKSLDKVFKMDLSSVYNLKLFPIEVGDDLNQAVLVHFARSGHFQIAQEFRQEAGLASDAELLKEFSIMYEIDQSLKKGILEPAIRWAQEKKKLLQDRGSSLEFTLHKVQFVWILQNDNPMKALEYAQNNLAPFGNGHLSEISKLMCSVLYLNSTPYDLDIPSFAKLSWMFSAEFCSLLGLTPESPVYLAALAGTLALPVIAKMDSVMRAKRAEWTSQKELPTEIDLPKSLIFHRIFVCPVSKEQTTEENPPRLLPCGHVMAKLSLESMKKDSITGKFKCPYCPMTSTYTETRRVYF